MLVCKGLQATMVLVIIYKKLLRMDDDRILEKTAASCALLVMAEAIDFLLPHPGQVTLFDLMMYLSAVLLFLSLDRVCHATKLLLRSALDNQTGINGLANALFEEDSTNEVLPGFAILHIEKNQKISLLRHNRSLLGILLPQNTCQEAQAREDSSNMYLRDVLASRLLDNLSLSTDEEESVQRTSELRYFRSVLTSEFLAWGKSKRPQENHQGRLPLLLKRLFKCDQPASPASQHMVCGVPNPRISPELKLEIIVRVLAADEPLFFVKINPVDCQEKVRCSRIVLENKQVGSDDKIESPRQKALSYQRSRSAELVPRIARNGVVAERPSRLAIHKQFKSPQRRKKNALLLIEDDQAFQDSLASSVTHEAWMDAKLAIPYEASSLPNTESDQQPGERRIQEESKGDPNEHFEIEVREQTSSRATFNQFDSLVSFGERRNPALQASFGIFLQEPPSQSRSIEVDFGQNLQIFTELQQQTQSLPSNLNERRGREALVIQIDSAQSSSQPESEIKDASDAQALYKMFEMERQKKRARCSSQTPAPRSSGSLENQKPAFFKRRRSILIVHDERQMGFSPQSQKEARWWNQNDEKESLQANKSRIAIKSEDEKLNQQQDEQLVSVSDRIRLRSQYTNGLVTPRLSSPQISNNLRSKYPEALSSDSSHNIAKLREDCPLQIEQVQVEEYSLTSSTDRMEQRIRNNEVFVYKIIHDLRHPTEFLANNLTQLSCDLAALFFKNDQRLKLNGQKVFQYVVRSKIKHALAYLKDNFRAVSDSRQVDRDDKARGKKIQMITSKRPFQNRLIDEEDNQDAADSVSRKREDKSDGEAKPRASSADKLKSGILKLQQEFWSLDINRIRIAPQAQPRREEPPINAIVIEEEKKQEGAELVAQPSDEKKSDEEGKESSSEEPELSVGEEGETCQIEQISSAKDPQKKSFVREDVRDLVESSRAASGSPLRPYQRNSLAIERLLLESSASLLMVDQKPCELFFPSKRSNSEMVNVHKMIDVLKRDSAKVSSSRQSNERAVLRAPSQPILQRDSPSRLISQQKSEARSCNHFVGGQNEGVCEVQAQWRERERKLLKCVQMLTEEREYLVEKLNKLLETTSNLQTQMETMGGQASLMLVLMRDLMNQAQLANNTFTMVNDYFNCVSVIKTCMTVLLPQAKLKKVRLVGPVFTNPLHKLYFQQIYSDERRYGQCILNFLSNSIKFTPSGGTVSVHLNVLEVFDIDKRSSAQSRADSDAAAPDKEVPQEEEIKSAQNEVEQVVSYQMIFRDTGCGISPENQQKLFMNFGKLHENQEHNKAGVGLGLSICHQIILAQGGHVDIQSEVGKGTDFIINLQVRCVVNMQHFDSLQQRFEAGVFNSTLSSDVHNQAIEEANQESDSSSSNSLLDQSQKALSEGQQNEKEFGPPEAQKRVTQRKGNSARMIAKNSQCLLSVIEEAISEGRDNSFGIQVESRCLLANDNSFLLEAYAAALASHFDVVDTVENGKEALDAVIYHEPCYYSAIVLDISMPIMDGLEACKRIREHLEGSTLTQRVPLLYALTSEEDPREIQKMQQAGFSNVFTTLNQQAIYEILNRAGLRSKRDAPRADL